MKCNANHRPPVTAAEVTDWIARYRASGLGLRKFAAEHGLSPAKLHYWVYQKPKARHPRARARSPRFQEVALTEVMSAPSWAAEISLPAGLTVRFGAGAAPSWIGAVVQQLHRPC